VAAKSAAAAAPVSLSAAWRSEAETASNSGITWDDKKRNSYINYCSYGSYGKEMKRVIYVICIRKSTDKSGPSMALN
jgi:hypothetical protein